VQTFPLELYVLPSQLVPAAQPFASVEESLGPEDMLGVLGLLGELGLLGPLGSLGALGLLGALAGLLEEGAEAPSEACAIDIVVNAGTV
jgi:hypothetical protein